MRGRAVQTRANRRLGKEGLKNVGLVGRARFLEPDLMMIHVPLGMSAVQM